MTKLANKIDQRILKQQMLADSIPRTTISFYMYFEIENPTLFRDELYQKLASINAFGRIYIASEGINAQVSVPTCNIEKLRDELHNYKPMQGIRLNIAVDDDGKSFWVLKIKVRHKIVADGITDETFSMAQKGKYVNAAQFNHLAAQPDTIIVDMRNHYEYEVGHFNNAIEVPSDTFREQLPMAVDMLKEKKEKNIIMYCTGGIRCEKASAYMLHHGFKNVYHLEGGIIQYSQQAKEQSLENEFIGKNFVFDQRLGERITQDVIAQCHQCGEPCDEHTNCANDACHLLFIQCIACKEKYNNCCSQDCASTHALPIAQQKVLRAAQDNGAKIFNKSKQSLRPRAAYRNEK